MWGSFYASGTITLAGVAITTVSFQVMGSSDRGATYHLLPVYSVASPGTTPVTTVTAIGSALYQINLAGMTHIQFVTTGTFTGTSVTLTLTASPNASISRNGSGGGVTASQLALVTAESFGAVGDWNGTTGTDNTTALQNAINSLETSQTCGQVLLQGKSYKISGTLTINSSCVGIRGTGVTVTNTGLYASPNYSNIVTTSASADEIDVAGTSVSANVFGNQFRNFTLTRTVQPTGTATGLSISYSYGIAIESVFVEDSIRGFYLHATGSQGVGYIENSGAQLGYNGVTETSGTYYGIYADSTDGHANPSLRLRNSAFFSNLGATPTTYGFYSTGSEMNDLMMWNFETAGASYGEYFTTTGGLFGSSDIHLYGTINDSYRVSGIYFSGLTTSSTSAVEVSGGESTSGQAASGKAVDIENCNGIEVTNHQMWGDAPYFLYANNSSAITFADDILVGVTGVGIGLNNTFLSTVMGNTVRASSATAGIGLVGSFANSVTANTITGPATNGIALDALSYNNTGLETNTIDTAITNPEVIQAANPLVVKGQSGATGNVVNTVFNEGSSGTTLIGTKPAVDAPNQAWFTAGSTNAVNFQAGGGVLFTGPNGNSAVGPTLINTGAANETVTLTGVVLTGTSFQIYFRLNAGVTTAVGLTWTSGGAVTLQDFGNFTTTIATGSVGATTSGTITFTGNGPNVSVNIFGTILSGTVPSNTPTLANTYFGVNPFGSTGLSNTTTLAVGRMNVFAPGTLLSVGGAFAIDNNGNASAASTKTATYTVSTLPSAIAAGPGATVTVTDDVGFHLPAQGEALLGRSHTRLLSATEQLGPVTNHARRPRSCRPDSSRVERRAISGSTQGYSPFVCLSTSYRASLPECQS